MTLRQLGAGRTLICWRRVDEMTGLELLTIEASGGGISVEGSVICGWLGGYRLQHAWQLSHDWRAQRLSIERIDGVGRRQLLLEREGGGWRVNGERRADLDGAIEPDVSITPFCNTLVIRKLLATDDVSLTVDAAYVDGDDLSVKPSRQRYERRTSHRVRYIDLGVAAGFEADLDIDDVGLVKRYEQLFERVHMGA
jgi:hypothetical protein